MDLSNQGILGLPEGAGGWSVPLPRPWTLKALQNLDSGGRLHHIRKRAIYLKTESERSPWTALLTGPAEEK